MEARQSSRKNDKEINAAWHLDVERHMNAVAVGVAHNLTLAVRSMVAARPGNENTEAVRNTRLVLSAFVSNNKKLFEETYKMLPDADNVKACFDNPSCVEAADTLVSLGIACGLAAQWLQLKLAREIANHK